MAFIDYRDLDSISPEDRLPDEDNILRVHAVHSRVMKLHYDLYMELMYRSGPLTREQREMIGVTVSHANSCHY